jgi:transcriptional regulator with XRE-family HTH domain
MTNLSFNNWHILSDHALEAKIGEFIKHHRLKQNLTQTQVSKEAGISRSTLSLLERGETVTISTLLRTLRVLELLYVLESFKIQHPISPIKQANYELNQRKRASNNQVNEW